jgi:hypothetical protein
MTRPFGTTAHVTDADVIFVHAGLEERKLYGLNLFLQRRAPQILFSVGRFELRKFSKLGLPATVDLLQIAASTPPPQRHFFVWFDGTNLHTERIPLSRFGTLDEMKALIVWLEDHRDVRSVIFVSSAYHLPRVRLCYHALLRGRIRAQFASAPELHVESQSSDRFRHFHRCKMIFREISKIPVYAIMLCFHKT